MEILIVREPISAEVLAQLAGAWHETLVKGAADIERGVIALGGEWHMDANTVLLADGSVQSDVWGFNLYSDERGDTAIEYISLINVRPNQGNRSMEIKDGHIRESVRVVVARDVPFLNL